MSHDHHDDCKFDHKDKFDKDKFKKSFFPDFHGKKHDHFDKHDHSDKHGKHGKDKHDW